MDWERPKKINVTDTETSVIAWRSIFVGNELNELQSDNRIVYPPTTLVWFAFFWIGMGWGRISQTNPDFSILDNDLQPYNMFLKFFLCSFIMWCIVLVQYILVRISWVIENSQVSNFTDICSVANVSVLIMTDQVHGYYIHGKAAWDRSDIPMATLKLKLDHELKGYTGIQSRDFNPNATVNNKEKIFPTTTFEIYLTEKFQKELRF